MNAFERVLIRCDAINPMQTLSRFDPRIAKAIGIIAENLAGPQNADGLSRAVGLSLQTYIEGQRLARAAQMLALTNWTVAQIARDVGFADAYYFSTRFRRHFGKPPTMYRAEAANLNR